MKQHLLRCESAVVKFEGLIAALRQDGQRAGWLHWQPDAEEAPAALPPGLDAAANLGVMRAVAVAERRAVVVKPMRGQAVLKDVLREHFRGCCLVLVDGELDAPTLTPQDDGWLISQASSNQEALWQGTTAQLVARLRRARSLTPDVA